MTSIQNHPLWIYDLLLHQMVAFAGSQPGENIYVLRVPGGWIYLYSTMYATSQIFVPFNEEFLDCTIQKR